MYTHIHQQLGMSSNNNRVILDALFSEKSLHVESSFYRIKIPTMNIAFSQLTRNCKISHV